jgi:hypothetical protein
MLQRKSPFRELKYPWHQIYFVHDFALPNGDRGLSVRQLSRAFECDDGRVKAALDNRFKTQKSAVGILPSTMIRRSKFSNGFKHKPKNMRQSHAQNFNTTAKSNIPCSFLEDGLILSFCATERI